MGGLWVDYNLMSNLPGLHVLGEANFSDHGANRLGASALMQGLADGYFVIPATIANYLATQKPGSVTTDHPEFKQVEEEVRRAHQQAARRSRASAPSIPSTANSACSCGTSAAWPAPAKASTRRSKRSPHIREEFWENVRVPGTGDNAQHGTRKGRPRRRLPRVRRDACATTPATARNPAAATSASEHQFTEDDAEVKSGITHAGEAKRDDENFCHVSAWEFTGVGTKPEPPQGELAGVRSVNPSVRSYK